MKNKEKLIEVAEKIGLPKDYFLEAAIQRVSGVDGDLIEILEAFCEKNEVLQPEKDIQKIYISMLNFLKKEYADSKFFLAPPHF